MFGLNFGATSSSGGAPVPAAYDFENSLLYDGVNDYCTLPSNLEIAASSTEFTISVWLNPELGLSNGQMWFFENSNGSDMWFFYPSATYLRLNGSGNQNVWSYGYSTAGHIGSWHHYVVTRDSSNVIEMYVDGVQQTKTTSNINSNNVQIQYVGTRSNILNANKYIGEIDDFIAVGGYCATQQNVTDLYNAGAGVDPTTILTSGVVAYWEFNETIGTTASDSSGNGNDLTLNNFTGDYWIPHYPPRIFNNAIFPDGINDEGTTASSITISWSVDWVVSFWFKGTGSSNDTNVVLSSSISSGYYWYIRQGTTPYIRYQSGGNNTRQDWSNGALGAWDDGDWHHLYMYNVGADVHLVFDGVDYGDGGATGSQDGVNVDYMFYRGSTSTFYSNLGMDDVICTQTTGSVTQAQALYNGGDGANPVAVFGSTPDYLYKFDINNGETTVPNSGNAGSNDLTLTNFTGTYINAH